MKSIKIFEDGGYVEYYLSYHQWLIYKGDQWSLWTDHNSIRFSYIHPYTLAIICKVLVNLNSGDWFFKDNLLHSHNGKVVMEGLYNE